MTGKKHFDYESRVLVEIIGALESWGAALRRLDGGDPQEWWARAFHSNNPAQQMQDWGVLFAPSHWVKNEIDGAVRQAFSRAVRRLAGLGLVLLIRRHAGRVTHLQPTAQGLRVGVALVRSTYGVLPNHADIMLALTVTRWATPEHLAAVDAIQERTP